VAYFSSGLYGLMEWFQQPEFTHSFCAEVAVISTITAQRFGGQDISFMFLKP